MKKVFKTAAWVIGIIAVICIAIMLLCNQLVVSNAKGKTFSEIDNIAPAEVGLVLGTTPQTRLTHRKNYFFKYRIDAAEQLYKNNKVKYLLISGDEESLDGVNEPQCMKDSLLARGIPAEAILLDGKGYRTLDSVVRMCKVHGVKTFTIISQRFHNERALYLAEHLGLDIENLQAFNAKDPDKTKAIMTYVREYLARVKMFWDILTGKQPKELVTEAQKATLSEEKAKSAEQQNDQPSVSEEYQSNNWCWHSNGAFKHPCSFNYSRTFVDDVPADVEVFSNGNVQLCYWPLLGNWSTIGDFPEENVWLSPTEKVKDVVYRNDSKGIASGYTQNGNIYYLKQKIYSGGEVRHSHVLVLINPPAEKDSVSTLTNIVTNW